MWFSWEAPLVPTCLFWAPYALPDRSGNHGVCMIHFIQRHSTVEMSDFLISLKLKRFSWEAPLVPMCHFWGPYALPDRSGSANVTVSHPLARKDPRVFWGPYALTAYGLTFSNTVLAPQYPLVSISNLQQLKSAGFSCLSVFAVKNIFLTEDVHRKLPEVEVCRIALSIFAFFNSIFQSKTLHFEICRVFLAIFAFKSIFQCKISLENFQSLKSAGLSCPSLLSKTIFHSEFQLGTSRSWSLQDFPVHACIRIFFSNQYFNCSPCCFRALSSFRTTGAKQILKRDTAPGKLGWSDGWIALSCFWTTGAQKHFRTKWCTIFLCEVRAG